MGVGQKLQEERLRQGFSLEEIEEETKIRKYYLQALEEEDYKVLPPRVYATGFVRRYAKFLGLDETEFSDEFKQQAYGDEEQLETVQVNEPLTPINKVMLPWSNIMAGIIFLVLAIWIGNYVVGYISDRSTQEVEPPGPGIQQPADQSPIPDPGATPSPPDEIPIAQLQIKTTQPCWLSVVVDGEAQYSGTLPAGEERSFEGKELIYIKAGNAGGLELTFNGVKQDPLGLPGEVKEREFPAE
jgi:cytoskeleton protein RodZ